MLGINSHAEQLWSFVGKVASSHRTSISIPSTPLSIPKIHYTQTTFQKAQIKPNSLYLHKFEILQFLPGPLFFREIKKSGRNFGVFEPSVRNFRQVYFCGWEEFFWGGEELPG